VQSACRTNRPGKGRLESEGGPTASTVCTLPYMHRVALVFACLASCAPPNPRAVEPAAAEPPSAATATAPSDLSQAQEQTEATATATADATDALVADDFGQAIPRRPVHTYSIVARDPKTGQLGVAVQSHWFSVGAVVPWAEAGVGAVATQSFSDPAYGRRGLELMKRGLTADKALEALTRVDPGESVRQVAFIDASGNAAAHTGSDCIEHAGHYVGKNFTVQANMMLNDKVVPAMRRAFERSRGDLAERLMKALEAAQRAGGDIRGRQSAALVVVAGTSTGKPWADTLVELRVEDHQTPIAELRRLLTLHRAYEHMNAGDVAVEEKDMRRALREYGSASRLAPTNIEMKYWTAVTMATNGRLKGALPLFREVFAADANWVELTRRLQKPGIIPNDAKGRALLDKILAEAP